MHMQKVMILLYFLGLNATLVKYLCVLHHVLKDSELKVLMMAQERLQMKSRNVQKLKPTISVVTVSILDYYFCQYTV